MAGTRRLFVQWLALLLCLMVPFGAAAAREPPSIDEDIALEPGEFAWRPQRAKSGSIHVVVSLALQRAFVYRGGTLIGVSTVSSGRAGYESPTGQFRILQKRQVHHSNLYDDAPMPFMQRLTWSGVALHGGHVPGHPASHGCIRLPLGFARRLFAVTGLGDAVTVVDEPLEFAVSR